MALTLSSAPVSLATRAQLQATTWTVPMSGIAAGTGYLKATIAQAGWQASCDTVEAKVRAHRGAGMTGEGVIAITGVMVSGSANGLCVGLLGVNMEVTVDTLPLKFDAMAYDARTG